MTPSEAVWFHKTHTTNRAEANLKEKRIGRYYVRKKYTEKKVNALWPGSDWSKAEKKRLIEVKLQLKDLKKKVDTGKVSCPLCDGSCNLKIYMPTKKRKYSHE